MMQPVRIVAHMQDGRVATSDGALPLDGILAAEWMRRNHPEAYYNASSHMLTNDLITADLPLDRRGYGADWYWACSFNRAPMLAEYTVFWHKRLDDSLEQYVDFTGKRGRVDVKKGKYKAHRTPLVVQIYDKLTWYAVGEMGGIKDLLTGVTHVGKKTSQGLGAVDWWEVEPWHADWSEVDSSGIARALLDMPPGISEGGAARRQNGIRPPYWHHAHQRLCWVPA